MNIDIISDLHKIIGILIIIQHILVVKKRIIPITHIKLIDILVISGDVSDNLEMTLKYISISDNYKDIIFEDGNHEHSDRYPLLYSKEEIKKKNKKS